MDDVERFEEELQELIEKWRPIILDSDIADALAMEAATIRENAQ